jgi:hypothetical protein
MSKKKNKNEESRKDTPPRTPEEWEELRARQIREGRLRPAKAPFNLEEWRKLPKPDFDPEVAAWILKDLIEGRYR